LVKSKSDLNPKDFAVIIVSYVLNDQKRHYEYDYSNSNKKRDAGTPNMSSVHGNRPDQQAKCDG